MRTTRILAKAMACVAGSILLAAAASCVGEDLKAFAPACEEGRACAPGLVCVNDRCVPDGALSDAGRSEGEMDSTAGDAGDGAAQIPLTTALVAYWPLDTDALDRGPSHLDLSTTGVSYVAGAGPRRGALARTSTSNIEQTSNNSALDLKGSFTLQVWFSLATPSESILAKVNTGGGEGWSVAYFKTGRISFFAAPSGTFYADVSVTNWAHLVIVSDTTKVKIYVDGQLFLTQQATTLVATASPLYVGQNGTQKESGMFDEIAIWNRALAPEDVSRLYAEGNGLSLLP